MSKHFYEIDVVSETPEESAKEETQEENRDDGSFSSTFGIVFSLLGCVVGTGNIWRFPRICAQNSESNGSLAFLIVWLIFLFLWSSPMILIEYAVGRYCKTSPVRCFFKMLGNKSIWAGGWIVSVTFMMSCYYSVIVGWCLYYIYLSIEDAIQGNFPVNEEQSIKIFEEFTNSQGWPILTHFLAIVIAGACVLGGISWIEKANFVLVPTLLVILFFTFVWSLTRDYADYGLMFFFKPQWDSLTNPRLWVDAASQSAFDTGAAMGLFVPYAAYFTRKTGVVRLAYLVPVCNNFVSLICGMTIFGTVFSTLIDTDATLTRTGILEIIKKSGPGSTGLTFIWIPILFAKVGPFGYVMCILFFFCLSFAGISSLIANIQLSGQALADFGVYKRLSVPIAILSTFSLGIFSALYMDVLRNQDFVWGFALMISGLMFQGLVVIYGIMKFKKHVVNRYGHKDWKLRINWVIIILVIAPLEALGLLGWWAFDLISEKNPKEGERWYQFNVETLATTLTEWIVLLVLLLLLNLFLYYKQPAWMRTSNLPDTVPITIQTASIIEVNAAEDDDKSGTNEMFDNPAYTSSNLELGSTYL